MYNSNYFRERLRDVLKKKGEYLIAGSIFFMAFLIRVFDLQRFPLHHDEANRMLAGADNFTFFLGIPVACFHGNVWPISSFFISLSRNFFSSLEYAVRFPSVIFGTLTIPLVYLLCRIMYERKAAIFSTLLLTFLPWHIYQSRDGREMIYTPFFGSLIFLLLFLSMKKHNKLLFIFSCFFLGIGCFYTYGASLAYIFVFLLMMIVLRKEFSWLDKKSILLSIFVLGLVVFPLVHLHLQGVITWTTFRGYHQNPFSDGSLILNLWSNLSQNFPIALDSLFLGLRGRSLYAASFDAPLLIHMLSFFIILLSFFHMMKERKPQDKIVLVWFLVAMAGSLILMSHFLPEYIIAAQVPLVILFGRGLGFFYDTVSARLGYKAALVFTWIPVVLLIILSLLQVQKFYRFGSEDFQVCRRNSYGSREAAFFLSRLTGIENSNVYSDTRMTVDTYLNSLIKKGASGGENNISYYVIWAPESHPADYWNGTFSYNIKQFNFQFPGQFPMHTIFYPNGVPAINIFKVIGGNT